MFLNKITIFTRDVLYKLENNLINLFFRGFPPGLCSLPATQGTNMLRTRYEESPSVLDFLHSPFLFAVPKHRRSIEKRRNRKFGWPQLVWKPLVAKTNILMCDHCGNDYEAGHLCAYCYRQVKLETEEMQKAIENELKLNPVEKEVVVLYEGEANGKPEEFWKGKRIVEMKKPRPSWFSANLTQKSTLSESEDKNPHVKPSNLA